MIRIGVVVPQQHSDLSTMRDAWLRAEEMGADTLHVWDHFYPITGQPNGTGFEAMALLAAMAEVTQYIEFGALVLSNSYRNPHLVADAARTIDHISGGRHILGLGAGWFERDYAEYGYAFGTAAERLRALDRDVPIIRDRLERLNPPPVRRMPILIGGAGERVTLRITAQHADIWSGGRVDVDGMRHKNEVLDVWCDKYGRDPRDIERSVSLWDMDWSNQLDDYVDAGVTHFAHFIGDSTDFESDPGFPPMDWKTLEDLLAWRDTRNERSF
jgi:probable F420-dependent oxidoreductase